jgi:hypothetical protein
MMQASQLDHEAMLAQFNRLIQELLRGSITRNTFKPWEIEIFLDIETCLLKDGGKRELLRRYQKAVIRQMNKGAEMPMKLSEFLEIQKAKRGESDIVAVSNVSPAPL